MNPWTDILSPAALRDRYALIATIDPSFARQQRAYYEMRTALQLAGLAQGAWNSCDAETYQLARSYAAVLTAGATP